MEERDGEGVGGHGVHLSPWIQQEYTFRHRNARRTPANSGQEGLTSGKEYIKKPMQNLLGKLLAESLFLTRDQALSLWSGSTDSKTLDYQRTNPREYHIVGTHPKENT